MSTLTENLAARYATAVTDALAAEFVSLRHDAYTERMLRRSIIRHAQQPDEPFETCIDMPRNWRLHREDGFRERWRVRLACHKDNWTDKDIRFTDSVNARLRAIKLGR